MKLHELVENKIYIGDDGGEYSHDGWHLVDVNAGEYIMCYSTLTQNFTPKKVKRTIEVVVWLNIYPDGHTCNHRTKEEADKHAVDNRISCVEMRGSYEVEE